MQFIVDVIHEIQRKVKQMGQDMGKKGKIAKKRKKNSRKRRAPEKLDVIEEEEEEEKEMEEKDSKEMEEGDMKEEPNPLPQSVPEEPSEIQLDQPPDELNEIGKKEESEILEIPENIADTSSAQPEEPSKAEEQNESASESESDSFFDEPEYSTVC